MYDQYAQWGQQHQVRWHACASLSHLALAQWQQQQQQQQQQPQQWKCAQYQQQLMQQQQQQQPKTTAVVIPSERTVCPHTCGCGLVGQPHAPSVLHRMIGNGQMPKHRAAPGSHPRCTAQCPGYAFVTTLKRKQQQESTEQATARIMADLSDRSELSDHGTTDDDDDDAPGDRQPRRRLRKISSSVKVAAAAAVQQAKLAAAIAPTVEVKQPHVSRADELQATSMLHFRLRELLGAEASVFQGMQTAAYVKFMGWSTSQIQHAVEKQDKSLLYVW
jgi:hypothetical protein